MCVHTSALGVVKGTLVGRGVKLFQIAEKEDDKDFSSKYNLSLSFDCSHVTLEISFSSSHFLTSGPPAQ